MSRDIAMSGTASPDVTARRARRLKPRATIWAKPPYGGFSRGEIVPGNWHCAGEEEGRAGGLRSCVARGFSRRGVFGPQPLHGTSALPFGSRQLSPNVVSAGLRHAGFYATPCGGSGLILALIPGFAPWATICHPLRGFGWVPLWRGCRFLGWRDGATLGHLLRGFGCGLVSGAAMAGFVSSSVRKGR